MNSRIITYSISYNSSLDGFNVVARENGVILRQLPGHMAALAEAGLTVDETFMQDQYCIGLSAYEIISFHANKCIWEDFAASPFDICMISDEDTPLQYDPQLLFNELMEAGDEWDVYFPFDRNADIEPARRESYVLGQVWGLDLYFLSKNGVKKLQQIQIIKQPLDDEMLILSAAEELDIYCCDSQYCAFVENKVRAASRNEAVKKAIKAINHWDEGDKEQVRRLMETLIGIAERAGVQLVLAYGSLLGHVRHGGIMPWDDDVDLILMEEDWEPLRRHLEVEKEICFSSFKWMRHVNYYKVWFASGTEIPGYDHKFPFIDIWTVRREGDKIVTQEGIGFLSNWYHPLNKVAFEGAEVYCPAAPQECLDAYFANWRTNIVIFPWRHKLERLANFRLNAAITVDSDGRIMGD